MSKRLRTPRVAKRARRLRPSGERLSNPEARDSQTSAPDSAELEGRDSGEIAGDRASHAPSSSPPPREEPAAAAAAAAEIESERASSAPPPEPERASSALPPEPERASSAPPPDPERASSAPPPDPERASSAPPPEPERASSVPPVTVAAVASEAERLEKAGKKKGKKKKAKALEERDPRADSGALSLNDAVTRSFYDAPIAADLDDEDPDEESSTARPVEMTPELLERKAKLRRIVGGVCAAAALVIVLVAGKTLLDRGQPAADASPPAAALQVAHEAAAPAKADGAAKVDDARAAAGAKAEEKGAAGATDAKGDDAKGDDPKADDAKAEDQAKADDAKADDEADDAKADDEPKPAGAALSKEDLAALKKRASRLYNTGKLKDAVVALREVIAADPAPALYYLYLGDALTNTGRWKDARAVYDDCATHATSGPRSECLAMGGRPAKKK
jgi:hypothetical protein